jgi:hypothetical protein
MATQNTTTGIFEKLLAWLPGWLGFVLILLAGILAIIFGAAVTPSAGLVAFGIAAIASAALAWYSGATSTPRVNPLEKSFGGTVQRMEGRIWLVIFGLFVIAALIAIFA